MVTCLPGVVCLFACVFVVLIDLGLLGLLWRFVFGWCWQLLGFAWVGFAWIAVFRMILVGNLTLMLLMVVYLRVAQVGSRCGFRSLCCLVARCLLCC